ncbi:methyl-accepting chemotaxis protein [Acetobacterium carbinolicum]|uniref:methyl-accepting chemotaxis protein n=1 Tax=Acetobacterium carbinolicum TaxID=52690 RepID=UPI0039C92DFA
MKSIRLRLIMLFTALILAVTGILGVIVVGQFTSVLEEDAHEQLQNMALVQARYIETSINNQLNYMEALAQNSMILDPAVSQEQRVVFFEAEATRVGYDAFVLADLAGNGVTQSITGDTVNIADRSYFKGAAAGVPTVSDITISRVTGEPVLLFATPVYQNGGIAAVLYGRKEGKTLSSIVGEVTYGETGFGSLINNDGIAVGNANLELVKQQFNFAEADAENPDYAQLAELVRSDMLTREPGYGDYSLDGKDMLIGFAPVEGTSWILSVAMDQIEVDAQVAEVRNTIITVILLAIIVAAFAVFLISGTIAKPIMATTEELNRLAGFDFRHNEQSNAGKYLNRQDEIGTMLKAVTTMQQNVKENLIDKLEHISRGNLDDEIIMVGENDQVGPALQDTQGAIKTLITDTNMLVTAAVEGRLDERADASKYNGDYQKVIAGVNQTLDAVVEPIKEASSVLEAMARGDLTQDMQGDYKGEHALIKVSVNKTFESIKMLVSDTNSLVAAAVAGELEIRADTTKHQGEYAKIISGVNATLDAMAEPIQEASGVLEEMAQGNLEQGMAGNYTGEYAVIKDSVNKTFDSIKMLVGDTNSLVESAVAGDLNARADTFKHSGEYARIVAGVNATLDAMVAPIQEANTVLEEVANGSLKLRMAGEYQGEHSALKDSLNSTLDFLQGIVDEVSDILDQMANSNMVVSTTGDYKGDFEPIKTALNHIIASFNGILNDMNEAADQVSAGASQVSDGSQMLAQGSTEQAAAIQQLSSSIDEIADKTKDNAKRASEANMLSTTAQEKAQKGNDSMRQLQVSMDEINQASGNISKIIKVIDDIAFQTNILSLNAAVEAARAGQHGKGFAVVAEEVRSLAARSAEAAKETTALIEGSVRKTEDGTAIADETANALEEIVAEITKAAELVQEIAEASNDQATNITQINLGVDQVSQVVQGNTATAEQSAAASEELSSQSQLLKEMITRFKLK